MDPDRKKQPARLVPLSRRLETIVELSGCGGTVCDVGCDHAHVPIRLLQTGQYRRAIGLDVLPGPLGKAAGNLALYGMEDRIELRLSDGMNAFCEGEADTVVITGMGGTLMREILLREPEKTRSAKRLVLGPQSDPDKVRAALRVLDFVITDERLTYEDGKYYPVLSAVRDGAAVPSDIPFAPEIPQEIRREAEDRSGAAVPSDIPFAPEIPQEIRREAEDRSGAAVPGDIPFTPEIPQEIRQEAEDLFGPVLLGRRDPVLKEYLVRQTAVLEKILRSVSLAAQKAEGAAESACTVETEGAAKAACTVEKEGEEAEGAGKAEDTGGAEGARKAEGAREAGREADALRERHLARKKEIEHNLCVFRAALSVYGKEP